MKNYFSPLVVLALAGCSTAPESPPTAFRSDTLYYQNTASGQQAAQEVTALYEGRQKVALVNQALPPISFPTVISRQDPRYPFEMRQRNLEGTVTVDFIIDESGHVFDAKIVETTNPGFNLEALNAVKNWTFKPATRSGVNIRSHLRVPLTFSLH